MRRRCRQCGKKREMTSFRKKGNGRTARCKICLNETAKGEYGRNPKRRRQVLAAIARYRAEMIQFIISLKHMKPCADCGVPYPHYVMDFDHCNGKKEKNISLAVRTGWSKKRILKEVAKCELVCANCHRERTWGHSTTVVSAPDERGTRGSTPPAPTTSTAVPVDIVQRVIRAQDIGALNLIAAIRERD